MTTKDTLTLLREVEAFVHSIKTHAAATNNIIERKGRMYELCQVITPAIQELICRASGVDIDKALTDAICSVTCSVTEMDDKITPLREAIKEAMRPYLAPVASGWMPIETLELKQCHGYAVSEHGYAVSETVLLAIWFNETGITNMKTGRVWEEDGRRSLPDNGHDVYERVSHWMPLPQPPKKD